MLVRNLLHHLHGQLVVIHGDISRLKNRCKLMLAGSNLVVLGLGRNAELPELLIQVVHIFGYLRLQNTEIVILHLLSLRSRCTDQCATGQKQVLTLEVHILVDQKILLLGSYCGIYMCHLFVAQKVQHLDCLCGESLHGAKKRCLLIQCLSAVGAESGRNVERSVLDKCR